MREIDAAQHAFATVWDHLVVADEVHPVDALLCFGSLDPTVPVKAAQLFHAGIAPLVVVSGDAPSPGERNEAAAFAEALLDRGVPEEAIVREARARHTGENVQFGIGALRERTDEVEAIATVSWPLAARRCGATVARHHPEIEVVRVPALGASAVASGDGSRRRWRPTSRTIAAAVRECSKLERYVELGLVVDSPLPPSVRDAAELLEGAVGVASVDLESTALVSA